MTERLEIIGLALPLDKYFGIWLEGLRKIMKTQGQPRSAFEQCFNLCCYSGSSYGHVEVSNMPHIGTQETCFDYVLLILCLFPERCAATYHMTKKMVSSICVCTLS